MLTEDLSFSKKKKILPYDLYGHTYNEKKRFVNNSILLKRNIQARRPMQHNSTNISCQIMDVVNVNERKKNDKIKKNH